MPPESRTAMEAPVPLSVNRSKFNTCMTLVPAVTSIYPLVLTLRGSKPRALAPARVLR